MFPGVKSMIDLRLTDGATIQFQHRCAVLIAGSSLADSYIYRLRLYCSMQRRTVPIAGDIHQDCDLAAELLYYSIPRRKNNHFSFLNTQQPF